MRPLPLLAALSAMGGNIPDVKLSAAENREISSRHDKHLTPPRSMT